jgi:hypothetical protein
MRTACHGHCCDGLDACPTPVACGLTQPDVPRYGTADDLGEDESGAMERLEGADWGAIGSGVVKAVMLVLVLLLALFAGGEMRDAYRDRTVKVQR